jgi:hypothetical protein
MWQYKPSLYRKFYLINFKLVSKVLDIGECKNRSSLNQKLNWPKI